MLIEADSGRVLHADNAAHPWYPASVTKLMTLYVTLRAVRERRIALDSLLTVSQNAASQAPSKMGFKPGLQVTVDNALKMLMVKSANDIAVVLAEGVSGSYDKFIDEMNASAGRLGMKQTSYVNPNGLPADGQITSARDLGILARALIKEMPEYDLYWHISAIKLGKRVMHNYNTLIDRYPGADGMKTGFICASGFNLVASATRNNKRLIAVVLGAPSSQVRAAKAAQMLERGFEGSSLSWLSPSRGTVESLTPVNAEPPNLREDMCGKHRKRPAAEELDEPDEPVNADSSSDRGVALSTLRPSSSKPSELIGPLVASMAPIEVYAGPAKKQAAAQIAAMSAPKSVRAGAAPVTTPAAAPGQIAPPTQIAAVPAAAAPRPLPGQITAAPAQPTAPAFAPATTTTAWPSTFVPAAAAQPAPPVVTNVPLPRPRPRLAAQKPALPN